MANDYNTAERNREIMAMDNVRVFYKKLDRAKYISHLDITRCMQRALKRAKLPVWYTQGFNPHMYLTFALPLSLGYESEYEVMDMRMSASLPLDEIKVRLNDALPPGLSVFDVKMQNNKPATITLANYEINIYSDDAKSVCDKFIEFYSSDKIITMKKTKKAEKEVDLKPHMKLNKCIADAEKCMIDIDVSAGQNNINPSLFINMFVKNFEIDYSRISVKRKLVFMGNGSIFE